MTADERAAAAIKRWMAEPIRTDTMLHIAIRDAIRDTEREVLEDAARGYAGEMGFETFLGANVATTLRKLASSR